MYVNFSTPFFCCFSSYFLPSLLSLPIRLHLPFILFIPICLLLPLSPFFFMPSVFLLSFSFCLSFPLWMQPYVPMHHNQTGLLIHVAPGYHFIFLLLFFCEVASVWLAPDSAPPSHPHYIFTLRYPRTQWCTCTHIFFFFPLTKQLLCVSLFWAGAGFFGMWTWKAVSLFRTFSWWYLCSHISFCFTNDTVCLSPL